MRTVTESASNAITVPAGYRLGSRLTVYNSRIYFDEMPENFLRESLVEGSDQPVLPEEDIVSGNPYNMAVGLVNRNGDETGEASLAVWSVGSTQDHTGSNLLFNGVYVPGIVPDARSRVGSWNQNNNYDGCALWYRDSTDWKRRVCTLTQTDEQKVYPTTIGSAVTYSTLGAGACYPVSFTEAVILDIYEGAVRVSFIDTVGAAHSSSHRIFNPIKVLDSTSADVYGTHYAGAVKLNNQVFVYFTDYMGAVKGMKYTFSDDGKNGVWSDIFTSVPQDQSQFDIGNVFAINDRIFICGKFYREEQFASATAYTLLVWSDDGITFTVNRRTLVTLRNLRFQAVYDPSEIKIDKHQLYFISPGPIYHAKAPYQMIAESTDSVIVDLLSITGSSAGEFQTTARAGMEEYFENAFIDTGSYAKLELSQATTEGTEYIKYHDVVVTGIVRGVRDGERKYGILLQTDGAWHTSNMTHPFYMEFQGKQSIYDNFIDQSNMVHASVGTNPRWTLSVSFWTADNNAFIFQSHPASTTTDHMTADLLSYFTNYPEFGSDSSYSIKLFGWSRAGIAQSDPLGDTTNTSALNDDVYALYEVYDPFTGTKEIKVSQVTELTTPYKNFPQSYYATNPGSIPVVYSIPNPGQGKQITRLGIRLISGSLGATTYCLERIEIARISAEPLVGFASDSITYGTDGTGGKITNTKKAVPQILFSNRPYSAFNFDETMRAEIKGEYSMVGLLGLANDKYNFIAAYIKIGRIYLSKYVDGIEIVIISVDEPLITAGTRIDMRFWHRDGLFGFEYKLASTLEWPEHGSQLLYEWTAADGALTANDDIFHVGTYSFIDPPRFRITGFNSRQSVVGVLPLDIDPSTNTSDFDTAFNASGQIDIDGIVYNYSGKADSLSSSEIRGPFQLRNTTSWDGKWAGDINGGDPYQGGSAIEFLLFDWNASRTKYTGCVIASNAGYAWVHEQSQWVSWISTSGVKIILRNRSRHYSNSMPDWYASTDERIYITNGLIGIFPGVETEVEYTHSEGSWAFKHSDDTIVLYRYSAVSGDEDQTIHHLLDVFNKIAGTRASFPGDFLLNSSMTTEQVALQ